MLGRILISLISMVFCFLRASAAFFWAWYLNRPKSRILQTGGAGSAAISTRSSPASLAISPSPVRWARYRGCRPGRRSAGPRGRGSPRSPGDLPWSAVGLYRVGEWRSSPLAVAAAIPPGASCAHVAGPKEFGHPRREVNRPGAGRIVSAAKMTRTRLTFAAGPRAKSRSRRRRAPRRAFCRSADSAPT